MTLTIDRGLLTIERRALQDTACAGGGGSLEAGEANSLRTMQGEVRFTPLPRIQSS
jgi:hypothetical protein